MHLPADFSDFLRLLHSNQVEYLLIGGYAVGYHGYPRSTADMDVWIDRSPANSARVVVALEAFGFAPGSVSADMFTSENQVVRLGVAPYRLEILTSVSGVTFRDCYERRVQATVGGIIVSLISLADLKLNKAASGRPKDLVDLEQLNRLK